MDLIDHYNSCRIVAASTSVIDTNRTLIQLYIWEVNAQLVSAANLVCIFSICIPS